MGVALRPPHQGWLIVLGLLLLGMLVEGGTIFVTWRLCSARDHAAIAHYQATADSVNAKMAECLRKSCIFPRDQRP